MKKPEFATALSTGAGNTDSVLALERRAPACPGKDRPYRVAYLVSHPIQYQAPMLRAIAAHPAIDLKVFFLSDISIRAFRDPGFEVRVKWDVPLLEGYEHTFLPALGPTDVLSAWRPFVYALRKHLKDGRFDALWIHSYSHQANLRALVIAKALGLRIILRGESHLNSHHRSRAKLVLKRVVLRSLFKFVDSFLAIGRLNRDYYLHYGAPENRVFMMPYAVDNDFFSQRASEAASRRERLRAELGFRPGHPVILYASKLEARKRAYDLLEAFLMICQKRALQPEPCLLFVGDGPQRLALEARAHSAGSSSVRFAGFKNQTELPRYYDLCDMFVLPSEYEPWGLVVNEAMCAGKPVIVSDQVGAGADLVLDGQNGFVFAVGDVGQLADQLARLSANSPLRARMGDESRRIISTWSFNEDVSGLLEALQATVRLR